MTMKIMPPCPVCGKGFDSFLNLARHMVLKDLPGGEHQIWLGGFLGMGYEDYGFGHDRDIANRLHSHWKKCGSLPQMP